MTSRPDTTARAGDVRQMGGDRCPGALRLHEAVDGPLARIRLPGGLLTTPQCLALADAADAVGDGRLHVTARGNVELRAVTDAADLADRLERAALLPSDTHERVRNVVASPLAGLDGEGLCDVGGFVELIRDLDARVLADPELARLSGRFLFGLDDGRGDILGLGPDLAVVLAPGARTSVVGRLVVAGHDARLDVEPRTAAAVLAATALAFVEYGRRRGDAAWRIGELDDLPAAMGAVARAARAAGATERSGTTEDRKDGEDGGDSDATTAGPAPDGPARVPVAQADEFEFGPTPGLHARDGRWAVAASLPLGTAGSAAWRAVARVAQAGDGLVHTTPWRGVVVGGLDRAAAADALTELAAVDLTVDPTDPWFGLGACTGRPGCARALADVRAEAAALRAEGDAGSDRPADRRPLGPAAPVYLSGCARRCGRPSTAHVEAVARDDGTYAVHSAADREGVLIVPVARLADTLAARPRPPARPGVPPRLAPTKETA